MGTRRLPVHVWLALAMGYVLLGAITGFIVGGSKTSVASAAIPALAGLVAAVLAVLGDRGGFDAVVGRLSKLGSSLDKATADEFRADLESARSRATASITVISWLTLMFAVGYGVGLVTGSRSRISGDYARLLAPLQASWEGDANVHLSFQDRAEWLAYQQQLMQAGTTQETIKSIFTAYETERQQGAPLPGATFTPWTAYKEAMDQPSSYPEIVAWLSIVPALHADGVSDGKLVDFWPLFHKAFQASGATAAATRPEVGTQQAQGDGGGVAPAGPKAGSPFAQPVPGAVYVVPPLAGFSSSQVQPLKQIPAPHPLFGN